ncbi:MAG: PAS domain S-box protein, partial [Planctomycetales bacterium]|nr:PAS domain S-box protein [Planctomycetales bacterium]
MSTRKQDVADSTSLETYVDSVALDYKGQVDAINRTQAVIEFELDGTILTANDNFLDAMGYTLAEIQGEHHRMFVDSEWASSRDYKQFWDRLNRGEVFSDEFKRFGKDGKEVWIQASYNPIFDENGKPFKVVKYATDVTEQVQVREEGVRLRRIIEESDAAFMMVDRDFIVTYVNKATVDLLTKHGDTLRTIWPTFDEREILGVCIDQFHKDPSHQRKLLSNPKNLPYKTD